MFNIINLLQSSQCGLISQEKLRQKVHYITGNTLYMDRGQTIFEKSFLNAFFVDISRNRLLLTSGILGFHVYDAGNENNISPINVNWEPRETMAMVGLPCATWGPYCSCVLLSGCGVKLIVLDAMNFSLLEEINLGTERTGITWRWTTMGHEISPHNNTIVAAACTNGYAPIVDLRTGNVQLGIKQKDIDHLTGLKWSQLHENLLATTCAQYISIWDVRKAKNSIMNIPWFEDDMSPDIKFLDYSTIIGLRKSSLDFIDMNRQQVKKTIKLYGNNIRFRRRITFAVNYNSKPQLLYCPNGNAMSVIRLDTFNMINTFVGPLFPLDFIVYNNYKHEVYSFCDDEVKVWRY